MVEVGDFKLDEGKKKVPGLQKLKDLRIIILPLLYHK
nr:MAG TPA: hypothetical protein [Caudoviricetes sp.]